MLYSCCKDCDSILLPAGFSHYMTGFGVGSKWYYVDTLQHDTDTVSITVYDKGIRATQKKQFPIDCEECGTETALTDYLGFALTDSASQRKNFSLKAEALPDNSFTLKNASGDVVFIAKNISFTPQDSMLVGGKMYKNVIELSTEDCTADTSLAYCHKTYPYFSKLFFVKGKGIVRWEVKNHPVYGDAAFDLFGSDLK